jgi:menaquinone-9 beta-reductase
VSVRRPGYDVIIVGGGPSGSALGKLLAERGMSVVILEKRRFPRSKPCGGLITPKCARTIAAIYGEDLVPRAARASSCGCRLFRGREFVAEAAIDLPTFFIDRSALDLSLLTAARDAGCVVREDSQVVDADMAGPGVRLFSGEEICGSVIVGADGANSVVSRAIWHTSRGQQKNTGLGFVADLPLAEIQNAELRTACETTPHIFFGVVPWGYAWIFPNGGTVNVGVGGLLRKNPAMMQCFRTFVATHFAPETARNAIPKGHLVPYGSFETMPGKANALLVGDAAGLADPITGEGLGSAFQSAGLAAEAIGAAITESNPARAGQVYSSAMAKAMLPDLRVSLAARLLLFPRPLLPLAMRALRRDPSLVREFLRILSGERRHGGFGRALIASFFRRRRA